MKPAALQQRGRSTRAFHVMAPLVHFQDTVVQALRTHLDLGHTQVPQPAQFIRRDLVRTRLDHQSYIPVHRAFIEFMRLFQSRSDNHLRGLLVPRVLNSFSSSFIASKQRLTNHS